MQVYIPVTLGCLWTGALQSPLLFSLVMVILLSWQLQHMFEACLWTLLCLVTSLWFGAIEFGLVNVTVLYLAPASKSTLSLVLAVSNALWVLVTMVRCFFLPESFLQPTYWHCS